MDILNSSNKDIKHAAKLLKEGKLVAFPTETVYGVACVYDNFTAYTNLNKLKNREIDKPYTLMLGDINQIRNFANISDKVFELTKKFLPGSVTFLLPAKNDLLSYLSKDGIVGIRIPSNKEALELLKEVNKPLLVPSLNRSGKPPLFKKEDITKEFNEDLDALIIGEIKNNIPSTIVLIKDKIEIIREGKVLADDIFKEYNKL